MDTKLVNLFSYAFEDLLNTFRLKQCINCTTHEARHTLDSIILSLIN